MRDWYVILIIKCCTWWILLILFGYYFYDIVKWVACFFGVYVLVCVCNYVFWWLVCVGYFFGSYWYVFIERDVGVKMHPHLYLYEVILPLSFYHLSNTKSVIPCISLSKKVILGDQLTEFKKQKNNMKDKLNKKRSNLRWSKSHSNTILLIFLYECPTIKQTFSKECQRLGT